MSNNKLNEPILAMSKELLKRMKIDAKDVQIRGIHVLFKYEGVSVICKIKETKLFDFIEFKEEEEAYRNFMNQREKKVESEKSIFTRKREGDVCLRTFFQPRAF